MCEPIVLRVCAEDEGKRLDRLVADHLDKTSRSAVKRWIEAGTVRVNGISRKASYTLSEGEEISATPCPSPPLQLLPEDIPIRIIYEDDDLAVVNKPAGMVVHPGSRNWSGTLANALLYHFQQISRGDPLRPGIVHRLDKHTSGALVVAKNEHVHELLARQFKNREVTKHYLALVYGRVRQSTGRIDVPIGRHFRSPTKISTRTSRPRTAVTAYEVIKRLPEFTYLRVFPQTGRTHQIRVHLQHLGHPVVGDVAYAGKSPHRIADPVKVSRIKRLHRHFLHATFLQLTHPTSGKRIGFHASLPRELEDLLRSLGE